MVRIVEIDHADAGDVGRDAHVVVRDALGRPDGTGLTRAGTVDLELPHLVGVGHGQAFAPVGIAVFLGHLAHQADGVTGVVAVLERQAFQFLDPEHAVAVDQLFAAVVGGLADGQLLLVHARIGRVDEAVGLQGGRHDAAGLIDTPRVPWFLLVQDVEEIGFGLARREGLARLDGHIGAVIGVAAVGGHHRTVAGGFLADHDRGAGQARGGREQQQGRRGGDRVSIEQFHVAEAYGS